MIAEQGGAEPRLQLSVAAMPGEDDEVVETQGARSSSSRRLPRCSTTNSSTPPSSRTRSRSRTSTNPSSSRSRPGAERPRRHHDTSPLRAHGFVTSLYRRRPRKARK
jgi:hypothetical protein